MWEPTLFSRLGWGFKLFGRTILVQSVAGVVAVILLVLAGLLGSVSPVAGAFVSVLLSILLTVWLYQVFIASFARSMAEEGMPPLVVCLKDGLHRLPAMGNTMLLLMLLAMPIIVVIGLLGLIHPLVSLLGTLFFMWVALRMFTLTGLVTMENIGPWDAVKRAWDLSAGFELRMLGNGLFLALIFILLGAVLGGLFGMLGLSGLMQQFAGMVQSGSGQAVADPAMLLFSLESSALLSIGAFMVIALSVEALMIVFMLAYCFFFYTEQKMARDGGKPSWQPAGMADRKQWMIFGSLAVVLSLLPSVAVALNPVPVEQAAKPVVVQQQKAMPPAATPAKPAVELEATATTPAATPATVASKATEKPKPDSDEHTVKAPEIDIANLRDPFESYLTVLENQSRQRRDARRSMDSERTPEPLEEFDLGALKLVAIMQMGENRAAMVENHEGKGFVVRKGSYIGRDNGRVVNITERDVEITEDEFNELGEIIQRKAVLTLNEVNQDN